MNDDDFSSFMWTNLKSQGLFTHLNLFKTVKDNLIVQRSILYSNGQKEKFLSLSKTLLSLM